MTLNEYQELAQRTANKDCSIKSRLIIGGLGICGEAGEVAEHIKKYAGHGHELDDAKVLKEVGDVLWYCAELAALLGANLEDVAQANIAKLKARYPEGFSSERSINRPTGNGG